MKLPAAIVALAALASPCAALAQVAQPAAPASDERRLTPEQIEAVLAEADAKRKAADRQALAATADPLAPQVHGEVGFTIGTGGYREVYGTALYPLGEDGMAAISLDFVDWGRRRWPR